MRKLFAVVLAFAIGGSVGWLVRGPSKPPVPPDLGGEIRLTQLHVHSETNGTYRPFHIAVDGQKQCLFEPAEDAERFQISFANGRVVVYAVRTESFPRQ